MKRSKMYELVQLAKSIGGGAPVLEPVPAGSPADKAGIKQGDIITECNGHRITNVDDLLDHTDELNKASMSLVIYRDGKTLTVEMQPLPDSSLN